MSGSAAPNSGLDRRSALTKSGHAAARSAGQSSEGPLRAPGKDGAYEEGGVAESGTQRRAACHGLRLCGRPHHGNGTGRRGYCGPRLWAKTTAGLKSESGMPTFGAWA